ncbi:Hypothetical predicted protein [Mytilus galloprovincialis]|uniref:B box-type domain-containing protein n=1 Tax=Mytilus galloprovincialis TaxID=29158 RepID=A0A8B6CNK1_MYTGA|nr:Hypothetical predicted protein [Mytilus galloprovincialis]
MDVIDKKHLCSPCEFKSKIKKATKWCIECKERLCVTCYENHNAHRFLRNHHVRSVEGNQLLASLQIPLNEYCEVHDQEKELFCTLDDEIICLTCSHTSHEKCPPLVHLSDVTKNAKTSTFLSILESNTDDTLEKLRHIIRDKENNRVKIEKQKK